MDELFRDASQNYGEWIVKLILDAGASDSQGPKANDQRLSGATNYLLPTTNQKTMD